MRAALGIAALLGPSLAAQQTFIVDVQNRPGTDFTDLTQAVRTVQDGDTLIVRDGVYDISNAGLFAVSRGIQIHFEPGARIASSPMQPTLLILGIPAGRTCVLRGLRFVESTAGASVLISASPGAVVLEDAAYATPGFGLRLQIDQADHVALRTVVAVGFLDATESNVSVEASLLDAGPVDARLFPFREPSAARLRDSIVDVTDCALAGGSVDLPPQRQDDQPGLVLSGGRTWIRGASSVLAGSRFSGASAIDGRGRVVVDQTVQLTPSGQSPPFGQNVIGTVQPLAELAASCVHVGATLSLGMSGQPADPFLLIAGLPQAPTIPSGVGGRVWIFDPQIVASGLLDASGSAASAIPTPPIAALQNLIVTFQFATFAAQPGRIALSNPGSVCFRP